jgi:hypothetical protein
MSSLPLADMDDGVFLDNVPARLLREFRDTVSALVNNTSHKTEQQIFSYSLMPL